MRHFYRLTAWVVCALVVVAPACALAAAPAPTPTDVTNSGQLLLSQQHISQGTTMLGAAVSLFHDGERVTVTWARADGSGTAALGMMGTNIAGSAATTVHLPADASPATYTVTATGDKGSAASAFVTVDPPHATPAPTAISYSPRLIAPPEMTRGSVRSGTTDHLALRVEGYPPDARVGITLQLLAGGGPHPIQDVGEIGRTDAQGRAAGDVPLPADLAAGPYDVEATARGTTPAVRAGATVTLHDSAATALAGWDRGVFTGLWRNVTEGALSFVNSTVQAGRSALLTTLARVALYVEDWTDARYDGVFALAAPFLIWSGGMLTFAIAVRTFLTVRRARRLHDVETLLWVGVELTAVIGVVGGLKGLESSTWQWTGAESAWFVRGGLGAFGTALDRWTSITPHDLASATQWGLGMILALTMEAVMAVQLLVLGLTRLGGDGFLVFLWLTGAFCAATYALERTRGLALTWLRTIVAISLWPVLWGWLFGAEGTIVSAFTAGQPASFQDAFLKVAVGVAMLLGFNAVPEVLRIVTRHVLPGPGSEVDGTRTPFYRLGQEIRGRVPLLGRL